VRVVGFVRVWLFLLGFGGELDSEIVRDPAFISKQIPVSLRVETIEGVGVTVLTCRRTDTRGSKLSVNSRSREFMEFASSFEVTTIMAQTRCVKPIRPDTSSIQDNRVQSAESTELRLKSNEIPKDFSTLPSRIAQIAALVSSRSPSDGRSRGA
jgi:hypothetical protein